MKISLIAAVAENGVVGRNNQLPWYLPEDLKYFKRTTLGKPVMMGRKTFASIGKPLPGRTNIVISRQPDLALTGVRVVADVSSAVELAAEIDGCEELMVIGGAEIYALCLPLAQRLYLTEVHAAVGGDVYFPDWDRTQWQQCFRERHGASGPNPYDYSWVIYERRER
ncbi:MAG: type 3 dihydrofolate reductase [Gammaproteobacteria bacterium]|nr:type 3 dihydrofolate reductase [Gammaproteobacteria bacterium]